MSFTKDQRVFIVESYVASKSFKQCQDDFHQKFQDVQPPNKSTILRLIGRFRETGSIDDKKRSGRPTVLTEALRVDIHQRLVRSPNKALRRLSQETGVSKDSVQRCAKALLVHPEIRSAYLQMAGLKDAYIAALEKKLTELSGIEVNQIKKNQLANAADEAKAIKEMEVYINTITVQKKGVAQVGVVDPQISTIYQHIHAELGEEREAHSLPPLKYDYAALEPHISALIMEIHHTKHHQAYINNLVAATKKLVEAEAANDVSAMNALFPAIKFNGGGHLNHTIFWTNMGPGGMGKPRGPIAEAIDRDFGSFDAFKYSFSAASVGVKGSSWLWLGYCPQGRKLVIATCQNQDPLQMTHGLIPLLGLDVWEHAYYLQYQNLRANYVKAFFNVINWDNVNARLENAQKGQ